MSNTLPIPVVSVLVLITSMLLVTALILTILSALTGKSRYEDTAAKITLMALIMLEITILAFIIGL